MATFSAVRAATSGFRFIRERPKLFWTWFGLQFIAWMLVTAAALGATWLAGDNTVLTVLLFLPLVVAGGLLYLAQITAIYRAVLRPDEGRHAYYRAGPDELRQLLLFALLGGAFTLVTAVIFGLLAGISALFGRGWSDPTPIPWSIFAIISLPLGIMAWVAVIRLSLAAPATFDLARIDVRLAWRITRGLFWKLVGAFLLVSLLAVLIQLPSGLIEIMLDLVFRDAGGAGLTVALVLNFVVQIATGALLIPILAVPAADIYKTLSAPKP